PTRTPFVITPRPAVIAGIPPCLTQYFSAEALAYARDWRTITDGLPQDQLEALEELVCEGLTGSASPSRGSSEVLPLEVMTVDIRTGVRATGAYYPPADRAIA